MNHPTDPWSQADRFAVLSCDIFDTAIYRTLARPEDVHLAAGARLHAGGLTGLVPEAFAAFRQAAEPATRAAAEAAGHDEVRIAEIYRQLEACSVVTDGLAAARMEFETEIAVCRPIARTQLALAGRTPENLVFASDTCLPASWLSELLASCGYDRTCPVFASSDLRRSKHTGRLFLAMLESLGRAPAELVHFGDNPVSDVARPRAAGIEAHLLPRPLVPPASNSARHHVVQLAGSLLRAREGLSAPGATAQADRDAPSAQADRDAPSAQADRDAASVQADERTPSAKTDRNAPAVQADQGTQSPQADGLALAGYATPLLIGFSLHILAQARKRGIRRIYFLARDGYLPLAIIRRLLSRAADANAFDLIYLHVSRSALQDRTGADAYLRQSGFMQPGLRMVVDAGWRGSLQSSLADAAGLPPSDIFGCYLGLWPNALRPGIDPAHASGYLFAFGHPAAACATIREGYLVLELLFSAPHGTVLGYRRVPGQSITPIHETFDDEADATRAAAMAALETACLETFDQLDAMLDGAWPEEIDASSALAPAAGLIAHPTKAQVALVNRIPFVHTPGGAGLGIAVNRLPLHELLRSPRRALLRLANAPWRAGAVRAALPWPLPAIGFADLSYYAGRLLGRTCK